MSFLELSTPNSAAQSGLPLTTWAELASQTPAVGEGSQGPGCGLAIPPGAPCERETEAFGLHAPRAPVSREDVAARRRARRFQKRELRRLRKLPRIDDQGRTCYFTEEGARLARQQTGDGSNIQGRNIETIQSRVEERASAPDVRLPIQIHSNILIRPAVAAGSLNDPENRPALPSPPAARELKPVARYMFRDEGRQVYGAQGALNVVLEVPPREPSIRRDPPSGPDAWRRPEPEHGDSPGACQACYPLKSLETGYYHLSPHVPPPKTLQERRREREERNREYFNGTRTASPTDLEEMQDTLKGIPKAPTAAGAPIFHRPKKRPETEQPRQQKERLSRGASPTLTWRPTSGLSLETEDPRMETDTPVVAGPGKAYTDQTTQTDDQLPELIYAGSLKIMLWLLGKLDNMPQCFLRNGPTCGSIYDLTSLIVSAQQKDRVTQDLLQRAQTDGEPMKPIHALDGVLFYANMEEKEPQLKLWVPNKIIQRTIETLHGEKHLPQQTIINYAKLMFYWPLMERDVTNFTESCKKCKVIQRTSPLEGQLHLNGLAPFECVLLSTLKNRLRTRNSRLNTIFYAQDLYSQWVEAKEDVAFSHLKLCHFFPTRNYRQMG